MFFLLLFCGAPSSSFDLNALFRRATYALRSQWVYTAMPPIALQPIFRFLYAPVELTSPFITIANVYGYIKPLY
jgi:hypothetical protein